MELEARAVVGVREWSQQVDNRLLTPPAPEVSNLLVEWGIFLTVADREGVMELIWSAFSVTSAG